MSAHGSLPSSLSSRGRAGPDVSLDPGRLVASSNASMALLVERAASNNITLQVVKMDGEWHPGHSGSFMIYEFERLRPVVYLEHHRVGAFVVEDNDVREFQAAADIIRGAAMSQEESIELITDLIKTLEETP